MATSIAFSPDGKLLASRNVTEATVRLWEVATGKEVRKLGKARPRTMGGFWGFGSSESLAFSPDGKLLAVAGEDNLVRLLDVATGNPASPLAGHPSAVSEVSFAPDGKTVSTRGNDGTLRQWDAATGKQLKETSLPPESVMHVHSADNRLTVGRDGNGLRIWETVSGKEVSKISLKNPQNQISGFVLSPAAGGAPLGRRAHSCVRHRHGQGETRTRSGPQTGQPAACRTGGRRDGDDDADDARISGHGLFAGQQADGERHHGRNAQHLGRRTRSGIAPTPESRPGSRPEYRFCA
jgi:WD40 repeat protein